MKYLPLGLLTCGLAVASAFGQTTQKDPTQITKWQDGRQAAVAITYDDSTINQFRVALPLMEERGLPGTFFVITGEIPGSKNIPRHVGRPIMDILKESATVPTNKDNLLERTSVIAYLRDVQQVAAAGGAENMARIMRSGDYSQVDARLAALRATGEFYPDVQSPYIPVRSQELPGRPRADGPDALSWDEMRKAAAKGYEICNHSVSHAQLPEMDTQNIIYEVDKAKEDLQEQMGDKSLYSIEAPYGIDDPRVRAVLINRFPLTRNWVSDSDGVFMDGIMRGDSHDPKRSTKPYVEWERGPVSNTKLSEMTGWVDTADSITAPDRAIWLVLVIHGIDNKGWEPLTHQNVAAYFDYIKAKSDAGVLWVATYQDGSKYIRERMGSTAKTTPAGQAIEVTVTNSLDPKVYDVPLTAQTDVPASWTSAQFQQGTVTNTLPVKKDGDRTFVQYRIIPNGDTAKLEQGHS